MNKKAFIFIAVFLFLGLSSFDYHKFYVSIYQVDFVPQKKRIEVTARIFVDDLNLALEKEFNSKNHIGEKTETSQDLTFLKRYLKKHIRVFIEGKEKEVVYISKEMENNVLIIYLKVNEVKKLSALKIQNNALLELFPDQQNIMQTNFYNQKRNYIFTGDYFFETLSFK